MTLDVSAWNTTVRDRTIQAFAESEIVPNGSFDARNFPNQANLRFPKISKRYAQNAADDSADLGVGAVTEPTVTLSLDNPLKLWDYIPQSALNTQQQSIDGDYAVRLGRDLRRGHDNRLIAFAVNQAIARAGSAGLVAWDDDGATEEARGDAAGAVLKKILQNFANAQVPDNEPKWGILHPDLFFDLLSSRFARSRDFTMSSDNSGHVTEIQFGGARFRPAVSIFKQDFTLEGTELDGAPAKYLADFTTVDGVAWAGSALGVGYVETASTQTDYIPQKESLLVKARMQFGTASKQAEAFCYVAGD